MIKYRKTISTIAASVFLLIGFASNSYADGHGKGMNVPINGTWLSYLTERCSIPKNVKGFQYVQVLAM